MAEEIREYDVVVVGSGSGAEIVDAALARGLSVGWVDKGPLGGTCANVGCIPSKMIIFPADRIVEAEESGRLGLGLAVQSVDFRSIMARARRAVRESQEHIRAGIHASRNLDFYPNQGHFVDHYVLQVAGQKISGKKIFLASGARPLIPSIAGIEDIDYLTNDNVFELRDRPESIVIIGGGYVGVEFAHFFAAMGTKVTILQRNERLLPDEEPEISELLTAKFTRRMNVHTHAAALEIREDKGQHTVLARDTRSGGELELKAERVMVAAGRRSNADLLRAEDVGIETDERGYIRANEYLETNKANIWALGDAIGKHMFKHVANREAALAWHNALHNHRVRMDYSAIPHAVFSHPQVGSVGLTEHQAKQQSDILVGLARYSDIARGEAMLESDGFAKAIVNRDSEKIMGFHIAGPYAPELIQEVVTVMANGLGVAGLARGLHIHPAASELILAALSRLREPD